MVRGMGQIDESARMHWMDTLRGGAVLLVILFHAAALQPQGETPSLILWINDAAAPYRMPALMLASGILLPRSLTKPPKTYLSGKVRSLAWPWLVWTIIMLPLAGWENATSLGWWLGGTHTWFLAALFLLYCVALTGVPAWWLAAGSLGAYRLLGLAPDTPLMDFLGETTWYGAFFFAGAAMHDRIVARNFPAWTTPVLLLVAGAWAMWTVKSGDVDRLPVIAAAASLAGVLAICAIAQRLPRVRPLEWAGENSIVLYLVHWPVQYLLADVPIAGWAGVALRFSAALAVCLVAVRVRDAMPWLYAWPTARRSPPVEALAAR